QSFSQNHAKNLTRLGAKSRANADFLRTLGDTESDDAIHADRREDESDRSEDAEQTHGETRAREGIGEQIVHRGNVCHGEFGIDLVAGFADDRHARERRVCGEYEKSHMGIDKFGMRTIDERIDRSIEASQMNIADDADYFGRRVLAFFQALHEDDELAAQRILAGKVAIGKSLIDDGDVALLRQFLGAERAPRGEWDAHRFEIGRSDNADFGDRKVGESAVRLAEDVHSRRSARAGEGGSAIRADGADAWELFKLWK